MPNPLPTVVDLLAQMHDLTTPMSKTAGVATGGDKAIGAMFDGVDDGTRHVQSNADAAVKHRDLMSLQLPSANTSPAAPTGEGPEVKVSVGGMRVAPVGDDPQIKSNITTEQTETKDGAGLGDLGAKKYAEVCALPVAELIAKTAALNDRILASIVVEKTAAAQAQSVAPAPEEAKPAQAKTADAKHDPVAEAAVLGHAAAAMAAPPDTAYRAAREKIASVVAFATEAAEAYHREYLATKQAMSLDEGPDPAEEAGEPAHGGDPMGGAPPMGDGMPMPDGGGSELTIEQLVAALEEMGISPQELAQIASANGGGDMPPTEPVPAGMPKISSANAATLYKAARAASDYRLSGKWGHEKLTVAPGSKKAQDRRAIRENLAELLGIPNA